MFNGLSKERAEQYLKPFAPALLQFVEAVYGDKAGQDDGGWGGVLRRAGGAWAEWGRVWRLRQRRHPTPEACRPHRRRATALPHPPRRRVEGERGAAGRHGVDAERGGAAVPAEAVRAALPAAAGAG